MNRSVVSALVVPALVIPALVILAGACCGHPAVAQVAVGDLDVLLVRTVEKDILVLRPWLIDPPESGLWLWPVPAGTTGEVRGDLKIDDLRSAVWMGHIPLSRVNASNLASACGLVELNDEPQLPTRFLGTCASLDELRALAAVTADSLRDDDLRRGAECFAGGHHAAVFGWNRIAPATKDRPEDHLRPLTAVVLTTPGLGEELDLGPEDLRRGCMGKLIAVAPRPLVPAPPDLDRWTSSLLTGWAASGPEDVARTLCPGVPASWSVTEMDLANCDGVTTLHLVELDLERDLANASARVAASWCGLHPDDHAAAVLRRALADTANTGMEAAFAVWAWSRQLAEDREAVLENWTRASTPLAANEAWVALANLDGTADPRRCLGILAAFPHARQAGAQLTVDLAGRCLVAAPDLSYRDELRAIATAHGGWDDWRFGEQLARHHPQFSRDAAIRFELGSEEITAGAWAVAALAAIPESDAILAFCDALVESAPRVRRDSRRHHASTRDDGLRGDFWNGLLILLPRESSRMWPALTRLEIALADHPRSRSWIYRRVIQDERLSDAAATVLLASLPDWTLVDEIMAVAILEAAVPTAPEIARPTASGPPDSGLPFPAAAVGAAYVLGQRGVTSPILAALQRELQPAMRDELVFALALSLDDGAAVSAAIDAWLARVDAMTGDETEAAGARLVAERVRVVRTGGRHLRGPYQLRFTYDFRPPFWRQF